MVKNKYKEITTEDIVFELNKYDIKYTNKSFTLGAYETLHINQLKKIYLRKSKPNPINNFMYWLTRILALDRFHFNGSSAWSSKNDTRYDYDLVFVLKDGTTAFHPIRDFDMFYMNNIIKALNHRIESKK